MHTHKFDVHKKYDQLLQSGSPIMSFIGSINEMNVDKMMSIVESHLEGNLRLRKRLVNILVESAQNLKLYYCKACAASGNDEIFVVAKKQMGKLLFQTGNYILKSDMETIISRIRLINGIPKDKLGELYRGILDYGSVSDEGGAGLGFIDIARKSDAPLTYTLDEIDDKTDFFTLEISIDI